MINSDHAVEDRPDDAEVDAIMRSGTKGAVVVVGIATAIVVAIWFAFYFLVFVPRAGAP